MISIMFHSAGLEKLAWRSQYISKPIELKFTLKTKLSIIRCETHREVLETWLENKIRYENSNT